MPQSCRLTHFSHSNSSTEGNSAWYSQNELRKTLVPFQQVVPPVFSLAQQWELRPAWSWSQKQDTFVSWDKHDVRAGVPVPALPVEDADLPFAATNWRAHTTPPCPSKLYKHLLLKLDTLSRNGDPRQQLERKADDNVLWGWLIYLCIYPSFFFFSPSVTIILQPAMAPCSSRSADYPVCSPSGLTSCPLVVFAVSQVLTTLYWSSCSADQQFCKTWWRRCVLECSSIFPLWF